MGPTSEGQGGDRTCLGTLVRLQRGVEGTGPDLHRQSWVQPPWLLGHEDPKSCPATHKGLGALQGAAGAPLEGGGLGFFSGITTGFLEAGLLASGELEDGKGAASRLLLVLGRAGSCLRALPAPSRQRAEPLRRQLLMRGSAAPGGCCSSWLVPPVGRGPPGSWPPLHGACPTGSHQHPRTAGGTPSA